MDFLDGHPLYTVEDVKDWAPEAKRRDLAFAFIDALAQLHALDPAAVGLGDLGKPEGYVERQINAWGRSWAASVGPAGFDDPRAHEVEAFLRARLPGQVPARIVHGDFGIHNILVGRSGGLLAVIDWEIATLGDPLADLAYALNPWPDPSDPEPPADTTPHAQPGFPTRTELAERYAAATGADLSGLNYYVAFNRWKSACIVHGVYARYMEGKKSTEGVDMAGLKRGILQSLAHAASISARVVSDGSPMRGRVAAEPSVSVPIVVMFIADPCSRYFGEMAAARGAGSGGFAGGASGVQRVGHNQRARRV
jgi:aminoglycoside phosphotransferase (APT) family kinase protein